MEKLILPPVQPLILKHLYKVKNVGFLADVFYFIFLDKIQSDSLHIDFLHTQKEFHQQNK